MAEYMSKELFLASMGLRGDETKYGNTDAEHQHRSYSTYMSYEIMDCVEDSEVEDVVAVVHGRWERVPSTGIGATARCSICGKAIYGYRTMNYCPNCGAKMDGE